MQSIKEPGTVKLAVALSLMTSAQRILDDLDIPGPISNSLDLAMARVHELLRMDTNKPAAVQALLDELQTDFMLPYLGWPGKQRPH